MNARLAAQILAGYRPSGGDDHERGVRAALKLATKNSALGPVFANQLAFDRAVAERLEALPLPEEIAGRLEEVARRFEARRTRRFTFRDPAVLAAGVAFLFLIGLAAWIFLGHLGSFAGMQEVTEMVEEGNKAGPERFKEIDTNAGSLGDWFIMQDFDGFVVPAEMAAAPIVGVRLFKFDEVAVAVAAVSKPPAFIYVFDGHPLGLSLDEDRWRIATYGGGRRRALAARQKGGMAIVVTLRDGGEAELKHYLSTLGPAR